MGGPGPGSLLLEQGFELPEPTEAAVDLVFSWVWCPLPGLGRLQRFIRPEEPDWDIALSWYLTGGFSSTRITAEVFSELGSSLINNHQNWNSAYKLIILDNLTIF